MSTVLDTKYEIKVLRRTFRILDILLEAGEPLNLETISTRAETPKSTTFRIITNLLNHGYITETERGYWLGLKLMRFGSAVEEKLDMRAVAAPHLRWLNERTGETVYLATLTRDYAVMYLDKIASQQPVGVTLHATGMTLPMHCTALGKAMAAHRPRDEVQQFIHHNTLQPWTPSTFTVEAELLAELDRTRARGYGIDDGERSESIRCIAAPVTNRQGVVVAAVSVAGPVERMPNPLVGCDLAEDVVEAARRISVDLGTV